MSRFNTQTEIENLAGGKAYSQSPELELVSILLTSFANDQYYKSAGETFQTLKDLIQKCDKRFVAQAAIYARTQFGMRSITHVAASELARHVSGAKWAKRFYTAVVHRPDDITEILSYHKQKNGKLTNAMKKGLAGAFDKFDKYQLAKYRGEGKGFKLVDAANILHPKPVEKNKEALEMLMLGKLRSFDTWETELSATGGNETLKKEAWEKLIREKKIGYFALLRNLRNIIEQSPDVLPAALVLLTDESAIQKSLVLPFRYSTAYDEIQKVENPPLAKLTMAAINRAVDIAVKNVPVFDGDTLVVLDVSGSMMGKPAQIGALFASVLIKSNDADFMTFSDDAQYRNVNIADSTLTIAGGLRFASGGTNFPAIFQKAKRKYDRVIILSDMQGWVGYQTPARAFSEWKKRTGSDPFVYSFDLNSYGSMQFPEKNVFAIAGFSEKIFDVMKLMEQDRAALISKIKEVVL